MQPEIEEEALRARLQNLRDEMEAGRVFFASHLSVTDSLKAVRSGPDGRIDLATVDSRVRALANAVSFSTNRRQAKEAVSLRDLQQSYFTFIERNFGEMYTEMKKRGADPSRVSAAISTDTENVKEFMAGMPEFLSVIDDLWKETWDSAHYHVQDLTGLKAVFGGETFPSPRKNIVSCAGVYADTIVLPDPFLRTRFTQQQDDATAVRWFVKSALSLLHYREAALADVECPLVVIAPDASYVDDDEQEVMIRAAEPSVLKHLAALFGTQFGSIEEASEFLSTLAAPEQVTAKLADKKRLLFHEGDNDPLEQQIQDYMDGYFSSQLEGGAGTAVLFSAMGRMRQATDLLRRASSLGGAPLIDAPTSWKYFTWKLGYEAGSDPEKPDLHLHMTQAMQNAARYEMRWLGNVPVEALIEMRKQNVLPELRQMLSTGVEALMELRPDNFHRTGDQVIKNIQDAFDGHRKQLDALRGKKWRFAGVELGACVVKGAVQIASACGVPGVSLIGAALDQALDVPKARDIPRRFKALREEHKKAHSSAVGLLFDASRA
ncbi:hypothetical protein ACSHT2_25585 [Bradyrhizobium sp. PUT101]|uniref:hypothetical protein n=1 Tax=Bradyrhizobium sp. PUT101 TaxID=3447427 RepID=UPI003F834A02